MQSLDISALKQSIANGEMIFFVGAGVSSSLGLPTWSQLINEMASKVNYDPFIFSELGDKYSLAEYFKIKESGLENLVAWMKGEYHKPTIKIEESEIHKSIISLNFPLIYTTNYDHWLERAFSAFDKKYHKVTRVADLVRIPSEVSQIVKFHGDLDDVSTIVLTETSYFERIEFESPLDIKLRSDCLGKGILFIGYSLTDFNLRLLMYKLSKIWSTPDCGQRPKSYCFTPHPNNVQKTVLDKWGIQMVTSDLDNPQTALEDFLKALIKV